jgi:uncharacterized membrane protein
MSTGRLEAFSDGVIAVAITLLVLNLNVPDPHKLGGHSLAHRLLDEWPSYAAYANSFATIGIIWINHHATISRLREADRTILSLNLLLLGTVCVLPFTTNLVAQYINQAAADERLAATIYAASLLAMGIAFAALIHHTLFPKAHMLHRELTEKRRRQLMHRSVTGLLPYALATAIAPLWPAASLLICGAVAAFYASPAIPAA